MAEKKPYITDPSRQCTAKSRTHLLATGQGHTKTSPATVNNSPKTGQQHAAPGGAHKDL